MKTQRTRATKNAVIHETGNFQQQQQNAHSIKTDLEKSIINKLKTKQTKPKSKQASSQETQTNNYSTHAPHKKMNIKVKKIINKNFIKTR